VPAFKHFIIKPNLVDGLTSARASYDSVHGRIVSDWRAKDGRLELSVTIPANTTATVYVPVADPASIKEGGKPAADAEGARLLRVEEGRTLFEVGSGTYHFTAPL
jgi:alpha-L-rhamnosidase